MLKIKPILNPRTFIYFSLLIFSLFVCSFIIRNFIGDVYYHKWKNSSKEAEEAVPSLKKAIHFVPSQAKYWYELGRDYHRRAYTNNPHEGQPEMLRMAAKLLKKAVVHQPSNSQYLAEFAWLIGNPGGIDQAITYFETALSLAGTNASIHRMYAAWALSYVKTVIKVDDIDFLVEMYRNPEEAIVNYEKSSIGGVSIKILLDVSRREWDEALRLGISRDRELYKNLADYFLITGRINEAIDNYRSAEEHIKLTYCYFIKQDFQNVFQVVKRTIERKDENFDPEWNEIKRLLDRIIVVNKDNWEAYYWLGRGYYKMDMFEESIANLENAIHINPDHLECRLFLAKSYDATGKTDTAIQEYMKILRTKPDHKEANTLLSNALKKKF